MADVLTVFNGPFAHRDGPHFQWVAYQGRIPYPRPGTCPGGAFTPNIHTTKEFPDDVVTFVRNHPMMFNPIYPMGKKPLVVTAADGRYQVLFLGTDKGTVQKVVVLPTNGSLGQDLVLEELEVFKNQAPVTDLKISPKKQQLYVSSEHGVSQVSLHRCHAYGSACADCCLARDPYCAWDGLSCSRFYPTGKRRSRRQDIIHGNPLTQCRGFNLKEYRNMTGNPVCVWRSIQYRNAVETVQYGVKNNTTFLECLPQSPQASVRWLIQRDSDRRKEVKPSDRLIPSGNGLLIRSAQPSDQGLYYCLATENGFKRTVAKIRLKVLSDMLVTALTDKQRSPWALASLLHPKALVSAFSPAEALALQQYCKEQRRAEHLGPLRGDLAKLKPLLDHRKSRNRRNHLPKGEDFSLKTKHGRRQ
ncbi:hypothetical protein AAFF_G00131410 [Aldrovandia affinis]|uniref:Semaphorin-3C n=1 Tax=Aldrovandia affinis TaxID=143900 RepID=A0AAD7RQG9_9TELE|nr:hypothetical protein AAFF_G00131410 [Aldrovandia affinis]